MPIINKQTLKPAPIKPSPPRKSGSMLSQGIPVSDLKDDVIKICIYGKNRTGKTTLGCQFPKPLLLVSFEPSKTGGAKSVKRVEGVTYLRVASSRDAYRLSEELREDHHFQSVVLDTVTSFQDLILQEIIGKQTPEQLNWGEISQDQYRDRSSKTKEALRPFLNLNCHTILLAQEKDHNPPKDTVRNKLLWGLQNESFFAADLGGATVQWLHDACDYIAQLYLEKEVKVRIFTAKTAKEPVERKEEYETGKIVRRLRTMYHPNFAAGFRSERPKDIPEFLEEPSFDKIYALIKG